MRWKRRSAISQPINPRCGYYWHSGLDSALPSALHQAGGRCATVLRMRASDAGSTRWSTRAGTRRPASVRRSAPSVSQSRSSVKGRTNRPATMREMTPPEAVLQTARSTPTADEHHSITLLTCFIPSVNRSAIIICLFHSSFDRIRTYLYNFASAVVNKHNGKVCRPLHKCRCCARLNLSLGPW